MQIREESYNAGTRWLERSDAEHEAFRSRLRPESSLIEPDDRVASHGGLDYWFCEFNDSFDFSICDAATLPVISAGGLAAEAFPGGTAAADATSPNLNNFHRWGRTLIGAPTTIDFYGRRAAGGSNELHSSVVFGSQNNNHGFVAYNPMMSLGISTTISMKEFGYICMVRGNPGKPISAGFFGIGEAQIFGTVPLTTAGALEQVANGYYIGFYVDTSNLIHVVACNGVTSLIDYNTTLDLNTNFSSLEIRSVLGNNGAAVWNRGYVNMFVDGRKILRPGTAAELKGHTFTVGDFALPSTATPLVPQMASVKISGANLGAYQVDAMGMWTSRVVRRGAR